MSDLISKKALFKALEEELEDYEKNMVTPSFWTTVRVIDDLPTVEVPQWIPCSERLPEEFSDYLATLEDGDVEILEYDTYFHEWNDAHGNTLNNEHVIAWMPLPEPYKG